MKLPSDQTHSFSYLFRKACGMDIYDLNYVYSSRIFLRFLESSERALPRKGILLRIGAFLRGFIRHINSSEWVKEESIPKSAMLFFCDTLNQKNTLEPISRIIDNSVMFGRVSNIKLSRTYLRAYIFSILFIGKIVGQLFKSKGQRRLTFQYNIDQYLLSCGLYIAARQWLQKIRPRVLVFANDHSMHQRVIRKAAMDESIKTVYIQHASVTDEFPVLEFDYALLQGMDTLRTYDNIGESKNKVYLIGNPKLDDYQKSINRHDKISAVGICTNRLDPKENVEKLIKKLKTDFPDMRIILRPHPGDSKFKEWEKLARECNLGFSNSKIEGPFNFLSEIDGNIAGNSNIHLEAVLLNVYPLFFDFALKPRLVQYSFLKEGLCEYYSDIESLAGKINELRLRKDDIRSRAKKYIDTIDTSYDFKSVALAKELLQNIADQQGISNPAWSRIAETQLEAYSLKV